VPKTNFFYAKLWLVYTATPIGLGLYAKEFWHSAYGMQTGFKGLISDLIMESLKFLVISYYWFAVHYRKDCVY